MNLNNSNFDNSSQHGSENSGVPGLAGGYGTEPVAVNGHLQVNAPSSSDLTLVIPIVQDNSIPNVNPAANFNPVVNGVIEVPEVEGENSGAPEGDGGPGTESAN